MLNASQVATLLQLQAAMNDRVDPNWIEARYPYLRAVVIEAAEAIEHHGWKWWKQQHKDSAQLQMELVDIWHFLLSEILLRCGGDQIKAAAYVESQHASQHAATSLGFDGQDYDTDRLSLLELIQLLIGTAAAGRIELGLFASILAKSELSWSELYRQYVSKNVLNFFRQDHGYQEGTYEKMWGGREDNEILVDAMRALDPLDAEFKDKLYASLQASYTAAFPRP
ncbi:MAG: dUTP diphosphatase [Gammaproteobacteria bacterium]|jgi:dimeric dUTPase (all-alpha-NTP-PPase superfamily)|nr:dUTP diphosphatase [Gammaproteobacteria bacterium]